MEVNKSVLVKVFSEQCEELYQDLLKIYPNNLDIKTGLTMVQTMKRFNPKLMIKKYNVSVNDVYYDKIMKGDLEYFIEKDYLADCHNVGYTKEGAEKHNDWIDSLKKLYKEQDEKNKKKLKKYFQQLSKICRMYYS
jgi:predicted RNase H-like HicB family nuclease